MTSPAKGLALHWTVGDWAVQRAGFSEMDREEFTERVIVLKVGVFREADCWVRLLSPSRGMFTAFAFGGCRSRRRFPACLDPLSHVLFSVAMNRKGSYYYLREGSLLDRFANIHRDLARLGMAVNCAKFVESAQIGAGNTQNVYDIFFQALQVLNEAAFVPDAFPLCFRARLSREHGFGPNLRQCAECGRFLQPGEKGIFFFRQGVVQCSECTSKTSGGRALSGNSLAALDAVMLGQPADWPEYRFGGQEGKQALQVLDRFVEYHMGLMWESGAFRRI